jgi:hypothetical protein
MMKARRTGLHAQAKPKVHRVVTIILVALSAMLSVARAETPVERGGYINGKTLVNKSRARRIISAPFESPACGPNLPHARPGKPLQNHPSGGRKILTTILESLKNLGVFQAPPG